MKQCVSCGQFVPETSEVCSSCSSSVRLVSTISSANRIRSLLATSPGRLLTSSTPPSSSARRTSAAASAERRESTNRTLRRVGSPAVQRNVHFDALAAATGSPAAAPASSSLHSSFFPPPSSPAHFAKRTSPRRDAPSSSSLSKHDTPTPIRSRAIITSKRSGAPSQPSWTYPPDSYDDSTNQNAITHTTYARHDDVLSSRFLPSATAVYSRNGSVNSVPLAHQQQQPHSPFDVTPVSSRQWQRLWQTAIQSLRRGALQTLGWRYFHRWAVWTGRRQGVGSEARRQLASRLQSTRGDAAGGALSEGTAQPLRDAEERSRRLLVSSELQARGALELAAAFEFHGRRTAALQRQEGGGPRSPSPFSGSLSNHHYPGDSPTQRTRRVNEIRRLYEENSFAAASARDRMYSSSSSAAATMYDVTPVRNQARWAADEHFVFLEKRELLAREEVSRRLLISSEGNTRLGIAAESARQAELTLAAEAKMLEASRLPPPPSAAPSAHMMISTPQVLGTKASSAPAEPVVTVPANGRVMSEAMQRIQQRRQQQQQQAQVEQPHRHEVDAAPSATVSVSQPSDEEKSNAAASPPHVVAEQAPKLLRQRATTLTRAAGAVQSMRRSTREHFTSSLSNPGANRLPLEEDGGELHPEEGGGAALRRASPQQPAQSVDDSQYPSRRRSSTLVEQPLSGGGSKLNETAQDHYRAQVVQILSDELKHRKAVVMQFRRGMETIVAKAVEAAAQVVVD